MGSKDAFWKAGKIFKIGAVVAAFFIFTFPGLANARVFAPNDQPILQPLNNAEYSLGIKPNESLLPDQPVFKTVYTDYDNDAPLFLNVVINSVAYPMARVAGQSGNYFNGLQYEFVMATGTLNAGTYSYYFETSDGQFTWPWMSSAFGRHDEL